MGAFLAPIFLIMVANVVFFIWVIVVLIRHAKGTAKRMKQTITSKQVLRITFSISGVLFLFGLTWGFFILTFSVPGLRETFQILFTVFNSLQGFFIFTFIFFTEGFGYWKEYLPCKKHKPSKSTQPSVPGTKSNSSPNNLPRQEKHTSENLYLNIKSSEIYTNKKADLTLSSNEVSSTELVSVATSYSGDQINDDTLHLNNNHEHDGIISTAGSKQQDIEEGFQKQTAADTGGTMPLNILTRRYSTKNYKQHHVEEVKV